VAALHPRAVVAGHKNKNRPDDPAILDETRQYLQDVIRLLDDKPTAREFYDQMTGLYPDRLNPDVVWLGARGCSAGDPRRPGCDAARRRSACLPLSCNQHRVALEALPSAWAEADAVLAEVRPSQKYSLGDHHDRTNFP
jgi:hypothetical protein